MGQVRTAAAALGLGLTLAACTAATPAAPSTSAGRADQAPAEVSATPPAPASAPVASALPVEDDPLTALTALTTAWEETNAQCRGAYAGPATDLACEARDLMTVTLTRTVFAAWLSAWRDADVDTLERLAHPAGSGNPAYLTTWTAPEPGEESCEDVPDEAALDCIVMPVEGQAQEGPGWALRVSVTVVDDAWPIQWGVTFGEFGLG